MSAGSSRALRALVLFAFCLLTIGFALSSDARCVAADSSPLMSLAAKVHASDGADYDNLGRSIALDGDVAVVGATQGDGQEIDSGCAYVFVRSGSTWVQQAKLAASDGESGDYFGASVAVDGDTAVVGAAWADNTGVAYVFTRTGTAWSQQAKLTASDGAAGDWFGHSVDVSGSSVVAGAPQDGVGANTSQGSAYVFTRSGTTWTEQAKITASDGATDDFFGHSVAVDGESVLVGAYGDAVYSGSAYVFVRSGASWSEQGKLVPSDGPGGQHFGWSVSLDGDTALIGAYRDYDLGTYTGSAYVFTRSGTTWSQQSELHPADGENDDAFGLTTGLSGDIAVVGAPDDDDGGSRSGSAYVFDRSGGSWTQRQKLVAGDAAAVDEFGVSVALSGGTALVGAPGDDDKGEDSGSAYFFAAQPLSAGRIDGATRYETAVALSQSSFADDSVPHIIVASGADYPDALAASGLAGAVGSPVLLVPAAGSVPASVKSEISRIAGPNAIVWIVGGEVAVAEEVASQLAVSGVTEVRRIAGADRYQTAGEVALHVREFQHPSFAGVAIVASGVNFPDALAASPVAYAQGFPVLLTQPNTLTGATADALEVIDTAVIVGGTAAVSAATAAQIDALPGTSTERWAGPGRYETATEIAKNAEARGWASFSYVGVASGENYPDALAGGPVAGSEGGVMLLVQHSKLPAATRSFLISNKAYIQSVQAYGGPAAIDEGVLAAIDDALK
jgi:putative cell wall-binding protein